MTESRLAPLPLEAVDYSQTTEQNVTDEHIRLGVRAAGASPATEAPLIAVVKEAIERWGSSNPNTVELFPSPGQPPARGVMVLRPEIFAAQHAAGTSTKIHEPVANIAAGVAHAATAYAIDLETGENLDDFRWAVTGRRTNKPPA